MAEEEKNPELEESAQTPEGEAGEDRKEPDTLENLIYCWAQALTGAVVGVVLLFTFAVRLIGVSGPSMQDTLYTGDRLLVLNAMFCDFKAGDVVVINAYNAELSDTIVKRIVATGGQTVDIDPLTGAVSVDGRMLAESYVKEPYYYDYGGRAIDFPVTLEEDEVFVLGDNRNHSTDSRSVMLGPVKVGYLQGKALFLVVPGETPDTQTRDWGRIGSLAPTA